MFKDDKVFICGEYRKYKDMPKKQTRDYQRRIEELMNSYNPIVRESEKLLDKQKEVQEEIDDVEEWITLLKSEETKDLGAIKESMNQRTKLRKKLRKLNEEIIAFNEEQEGKINQLNEEVPKRMAELASQMIDITPEEYYEKATETDELFMRYAGVFKQMYDARQTIPEMEHKWKQIIEKTIDDRLGTNPS